MPETARSDLAAARAALAATAERSGQLVGSLPTLSDRVPRSEWTVEHAAAHLLIVLRGFTDAANGNAQRWAELTPNLARTTERVAALNRLTIAAEPERGPVATGQAVVEGAKAFLAATAGLPAEQAIATPWYGPDATLTVGQATCLLVGEQVVHGYDIAKAVRRPWPISKDEARVVFGAIQAMMPMVIMPERVGPLHASFQMHLGRSHGFVVRIHDGQADVGPPQGLPVDCHVAADPVALMLVGYGRISQWRAIAHGKLITWGRKPWLAFRFVGMFSNP